MLAPSAQCLCRADPTILGGVCCFSDIHTVFIELKTLLYKGMQQEAGSGGTALLIKHPLQRGARW